MLPLGVAAADFSLPDTQGKQVSLSDFADAPALLVVFMCNHCPYVKHVAAGLAELACDYQKRGVAVVGINSNDTDAYPDDSPAKMAEEVKARGYTFPVSLRRHASRCQGVSRRVYARFLRLRSQSETRLPRADGFQPPRQRRAGNRRRPPRGARCRLGQSPGAGQPKAKPRLQHQMETRQRAGLFRMIEIAGEERVG